MLLVSAAIVNGCHAKPQTFDSQARLRRIEVVHRDDANSPVSTDVDIEWITCPGIQWQTVRSGQAFSTCIQKHKVADTVPVKVLWEWDDHGNYDWHVVEIGGCKAPPVDDDDSSFDSIGECVPSKQHDAVVGFHCDVEPEGELVAKCPWFRKR